MKKRVFYNKKHFLTFASMLSLFSLFFSCELETASTTPPADENKNKSSRTLELDFSVPDYTEISSTGGGKWMIAMYLAGDNNLNSYLYKNMKMVAEGLSEIRNEDETPKKGYAEVQAVALHDGKYSYYSKVSKAYNTQQYTHLYEINRYVEETNSDSTEEGDEDLPVPSEYEISPLYLKDITWDAEFMNSQKKINASTKKEYVELNMAEGKTLTDFLKYIQSNYTYDHLILVVGDHGLGPSGSNAFVSASASASLYDISRSMCNDDTDAPSNSDLLYSDETALALKNAGYSESNKIDMMIMDVCYGGSIEDAYEYRHYAKTMLASGDKQPGPGYEYTDFIKCFSKNVNLLDLGKQFVNIFTNDCYTGKYKDGREIGTLTFTDLSKVEEAAKKISRTAEYILQTEDVKILPRAEYTEDENENKITLYSQEPELSWLDIFTDDYYGLLYSNYDYYSDAYQKEKCYCTPYRLYHKANRYTKELYNYMFDTGILFQALYELSLTTEDTEFTLLTKDTLQALYESVIDSWSIDYGIYDHPIDGLYPAYNKKYNYFGLTICGASCGYSDAKLRNSYKTNGFAFKDDTSWFELLKTVFPTDFN